MFPAVVTRGLSCKSLVRWSVILQDSCISDGYLARSCKITVLNQLGSCSPAVFSEMRIKTLSLFFIRRWFKLAMFWMPNNGSLMSLVLVCEAVTATGSTHGLHVQQLRFAIKSYKQRTLGVLDCKNCLG